jgi:hypothetical protein
VANGIYNKVSGAWKRTQRLYYNLTGTWKEVIVVYQKVGGVWKTVYQAPFLPTGIIVPYESTSAVPSGFSAFTASNDKFIVGASATKAVNTTGGSTSVSLSGTTTTNGSHTGPADTGTYTGFGGDVNCVFPDGPVTQGDHSHTFSGSVAGVTPSRKQVILIKATQNHFSFSENICVLKNTAGAFTGMTRVTGIANYLMYGNAASIGVTGSNSSSGAITTSTSGSHVTHQTLGYSGFIGYPGAPNLDAGAHSHTGTISTTLNPLNRYMGLYKAATANLDIPNENLIGMWESQTPPEGWYVCDGTNGTPDLRDYFIKFVDNDTNIGTTSGSNSTTYTGSLSATPVHNHGNSNFGSIFSAAVYHLSNFAVATHTASATVTYIPPYYSLVFIMRATT